MKKEIFLPLLILLILFNISSVFSIPKPKNNEIGALVGRIYVELENDWKANWGGIMKKGKYYKGIIFIKNLETRKEYQINSNLNGFFYLLNIPPGDYILYYFFYKYNTAGGWFKIRSNFNFLAKVSPNTITIENTIVIKKSLLPFNEKRHKKTSTEDIQPMTQSIIRNNERVTIKEFFKKSDRRNLWENFEWQESTDK